MKLSDLAINRPIATLMVVLFILLLGVVALSRLNLDLFPDMSFPVIAVITGYDGVGPEEVETMVTRPLESMLGTVTNLKNISSISRAGQSMIMLEFNWGTDMDFAALEIREKVDMIEGRFPEEIGDPMVFKFDPSMMPIIQFGLNGIEDPVELKELAENELKPRLERIAGVASVNLTGGLEREIQIRLDKEKLTLYGLDLDKVSKIITYDNMNFPSGSIKDNGKEYLIRTTGEFSSLEEVKNIPLPTRMGTIQLKEIADVEDTFQEIKEKARLNGKPSLGIALQKQADTNTVLVTRRVMKAVDKFEEEYQDVNLIAIMNQSRYIEEAIGNVGRNAIIGGILAVLVLYFFLRNISSTLIVGTAIPISIIATFILVYFNGLTLNLMSLGGLALGIGMLVDNAIVILENIYRFRQEGLDRIEAAKKGSKEVATAIIASTLTTIVVFLPVVFVQGIASQLFSELALTVTFALLASLAVALTFIPMVSSQILTISPNSIWKRSSQGEGKIIGGIKDYYRRILQWTLAHRLLVIIFTLLLIGGSILTYPLVGGEFIPKMDQGEVRISVKLPMGAALSRTDQVISHIEEKLLEYEEVDSFYSSIGSRGDLMMDTASRSEVGEILVKLTPQDQRASSTNQVMEKFRQDLNQIEEAEIDVKAQDMMGGGGFMGNPISIEIAGPDLDRLKELANQVIQQVEQVEGTRQVEHSMQEGRPELQVKVDKEKGARMGLRTAQIAMALRSAIEGNVPTRYKVDGNEYNIRVKIDWENEKDITALENLAIPTPQGRPIALKKVADIERAEGPGQIERKYGTRIIEITADYYDRNLREVNQDIKKLVSANVELPDEYTIQYGGQYKEMRSAFESLGFALILSVILVYLVMAAQFESLLHPLTIMLTVPLALSGALFSLLLTGYSLSVLSIIGMIMLAGIVVNNAIVLVDYINTLRAEGKDKIEAILMAGPTRLRPILMTSLTTILGLLPLALGLGQGAEIQAPMAVVVIGGLAFSTFLTLIILPSIYLVIDSLNDIMKDRFKYFQQDNG